MRARCTAEIIAGFLNIKPIFTDKLRERNLGEAVGKSVEWAQKNTIVWEKTIDDKPCLMNWLIGLVMLLFMKIAGVRVRGENGTSNRYISEPERLSEVFGQSLRLLHEVDASDCPIRDRMSPLLNMVGNTPFRQSHLNDISEFIGKASADDAANEIKKSSGLLKNDVLIHGDYCLPNIILNNWALAGFIDVADGGLGDRHYDLAWGLWSLNYNLKTPKYGHRFLDAYGRGSIDKDRLRICGLLAALE